MSLIGKEIIEFTADAYHETGNLSLFQMKILKGRECSLFLSCWFFICLSDWVGRLARAVWLQPERTRCEVYSVSTDTHFTHKAWHDYSDAIGKLEYIMIGDPSHTISLGFDVRWKWTIQRGTFIIDPDGVVQALEINADGIGRDASVLIDKIHATICT